ncbi:MAG: MFS transporter [Chloroflexota bacterium]
MAAASARRGAEAAPPETTPSLRDLLRKQDVLTLVLSRMATTLGLATLSYGAMVFLAQEGSSQLQVSLMGMTRYAAALLFGLGGGLMADAMSKRGALFAAYAIQAALCFLIPFFAGDGLGPLFALVLLSAILGQLATPAIKSAVSLVATPAEVAGASALITVGSGLASAIGSSLLAPLLLNLGGIRWVMYGSGLIMLLGAIRALNLPPEEDKRSLWRAFDDVDWRATFPSLPSTAEWLFAHKGAASMILSGSIIVAMFDGISTLLPIFVRDVLGLDPVNLVYIMAPGGIGFILGSVLSPWLLARFGERPMAALAVLSMFAGSIGFFLIDLIAPVIGPFSPLRLVEVFGVRPGNATLAASLLSIPLAFGSTLGGAAVQTYINRHVPVARQGGAFGRQELLDNATTLFMIALLGILGTALGPRMVFLVAPVLLLLSVAALIRYAFRHAGEVTPGFGTVVSGLLRYRGPDEDDAARP